MNIEELLKRIEKLEKAVLERDALIAKLLAENSELKRRLNQNSSNSSKPPSLDGLKRPKPKSLRQKSSKRRGGQKGRLGKTLVQVDNPDEITVHHVLECTNCHISLENIEVDWVDKRQVFEIPEPKMNVIEHHCEKKFCPSCGQLNAARFPVETTDHQWARQMRDFLCKVNKANNETDKGLSESEAKKYVEEYQKILNIGYIETGGPPPIEKTLARNLWERFLLRETQVLRFVHDSNVPFDNNQAERDLRMIKVK